MASAKKPHQPFRLHNSKDGQFYFTIVSKNNQVLATSEMYRQKRSVKKTCMTVVRRLHSTADADLIKDETA